MYAPSLKKPTPETSRAIQLISRGGRLPEGSGTLSEIFTGTISLPLLRGKEGLPVGLQVITRKYEDYKLLAIARRLLEVVV